MHTLQKQEMSRRRDEDEQKMWLQINSSEAGMMSKGGMLRCDFVSPPSKRLGGLQAPSPRTRRRLHTLPGGDKAQLSAHVHLAGGFVTFLPPTASKFQTSKRSQFEQRVTPAYFQKFQLPGSMQVTFVQ
ncbi:hypothetical protein E4U49_004910 [Claviceps purpurea]|nr:hypothetical protein E4U49_004910 [Claviceps purpurea]